MFWMEHIHNFFHFGTFGTLWHDSYSLLMVGLFWACWGSLIEPNIDYILVYLGLTCLAIVCPSSCYIIIITIAKNRGRSKISSNPSVHINTPPYTEFISCQRFITIIMPKAEIQQNIIWELQKAKQHWKHKEVSKSYFTNESKCLPERQQSCRQDEYQFSLKKN